MNQPIVPDKIVLIEGNEPAIPIHGSPAMEGVQLGDHGFPLFRVEIARLVRETQIIIVEAPDKAYLEDHIRDVYDTYEDKDVGGLWTPDLDWGSAEGTHYVMGTVSDAGVPAIVDVALNGKEDEVEWHKSSDE
jgi:hypothetical protein